MPCCPCCPCRLCCLQWHQTQQFFEDHFVAHAKCCGLGDSVTLHLVKESK